MDDAPGPPIEADRLPLLGPYRWLARGLGLGLVAWHAAGLALGRPWTEWAWMGLESLVGLLLAFFSFWPNEGVAAERMWAGFLMLQAFLSAALVRDFFGKAGPGTLVSAVGAVAAARGASGLARSVILGAVRRQAERRAAAEASRGIEGKAER